MAGNSKIQEQSDYVRNEISENRLDLMLVEDFDEVLSPEPISFAPPATLMQSQDQPESSTRHPRENKRRERCVVERTWNVTFGLFQHHQEEGHYILEMHKNGTNERNMYHVFPSPQERKLVLGVKKLSPQQHGILVPLTEISNPLVQPKYNLSLQERLGGWVVEERKRNVSAACDKYYIHEKVRGNFRSLKEVAPFILYGCGKEDLILEKEMIEKEETVTSFLREAYRHFHESHDGVETAGVTNVEHPSSSTENIIEEKLEEEDKEEIQKVEEEEKGEEEVTEMDGNESSIFLYAYNNPITKL